MAGLAGGLLALSIHVSIRRPFFEPLSFLRLNLFNTLCRRKILRHRPSQFLDRFANLFPHLIVRLIRSLPALHFVAAKFFLGLRCSKQIGGQFSAYHVVENLLAPLQPFVLMNVLTVIPP